jgi:hypothetical protein
MPVEGESHRIAKKWITLTHNLTESGNMLIMTLGYTQKTGDQSLIKSYVRLSLDYIHLY